MLVNVYCIVTNSKCAHDVAQINDIIFQEDGKPVGKCQADNGEQRAADFSGMFLQRGEVERGEDTGMRRPF